MLIFLLVASKGRLYLCRIPLTIFMAEVFVLYCFLFTRFQSFTSLCAFLNICDNALHVSFMQIMCFLVQVTVNNYFISVYGVQAEVNYLLNSVIILMTVHRQSSNNNDCLTYIILSCNCITLVSVNKYCLMDVRIFSCIGDLHRFKGCVLVRINFIKQILTSIEFVRY